MVKGFSAFEIIDAPRCDLCLFGDSNLSLENLRAIRHTLPRRARVIVIDTKLPVAGQAAQVPVAAWAVKIRQEVRKIFTQYWKWRSGIKIQTRYGCRLISCEELIRSGGEVQLVIDYRSQVDPDQPRPLLAKRLIWTSGFGQMMRSC